MDDIETYLILKYGSLSRAYIIWLNTFNRMPPELHNAINEFFADHKF